MYSILGNEEAKKKTRQMTFDGFYRGKVVDVADPKRSGRVRVEVYGVFDGLLPDIIPWAILANDIGGGVGVGSFTGLLMGANVFVFFEQGDHRFPVIFASAPSITNGTQDIPTSAYGEDESVSDINSAAKKGVSAADGSTWDEPDSYAQPKFPDNRVIKTKSGILVELDDTDGSERINIYHPSGSRTEVNAAGDVVQRSSGDNYEVVIGKKNMYVGGDLNITTDGAANIQCASAKVVSDGEVEVEAGGNITATATGVATIKGSIVHLNPPA